MIEDIKKLIKVATYFNIKDFFKVIFSTFFIIFLELLSITIFIPFLQIIINREIPSFFPFFLNSYSTNDLIVIFMIVTIIIFIIKNICLLFLEGFIISYQENIRKKLSSGLFQYYLNLSWLKTIEKSSSIKIRHLDGEVKNFSSFIQITVKLLTESFIIFFLIITLSLVNFQILLISLSALLLFAIIYLKVIRKIIRSLNLKRYESHISFLRIVQDSLRSLKDLKIYQKEKIFFNRFDAFNNDLKKITIKLNIFNILPKFLLEPLLVFILGLMVFLSIQANIPSNEFLLTLGIYALVLFRIFPASNRIIQNIQILSGSRPIIKVIYDDFRELILIKNGSEIKNKKEIKFEDSIKIKDLGFKYIKSDKNLLISNLNFEIFKGQSIGLVGPSGVGKSTLIDILLGLIKADTGKIFIDRKEIDVNQFEWKQLIGYVPQNINLIDDTLKNNITLDLQDNCDEDHMQNVLKSSKLDLLVKDLKEGTQTRLGENGLKISGGQKQRIGIARALYKKPKLLILDESTNSLDLNLEKEIIQTVVDIKREYTSLIISHRNSTIERCDGIYELFNNGIKKIK